MKIVGNLTKEGFAYFSYLKEMVRNYGLKDYVTFEVNVEFKKLVSLMQKSKVYFHLSLENPSVYQRWRQSAPV